MMSNWLLIAIPIFNSPKNKFQILSHIFFVICKGFDFGPV